MTKSVNKSKLTKKRKKVTQKKKNIKKPQNRLLRDTVLNIFNRALIQSAEGFRGGSFSYYSYS